MELRGRARVEALWAAWFQAFPDVESDILRTTDSRGVVAIEWEERGTHSGRLRVAGFDLRPSGRQFGWRGTSIYVLRDEVFESVTYHIDRLELALQLVTLRSIPALLPQGFRLWQEMRRRR